MKVLKSLVFMTVFAISTASIAAKASPANLSKSTIVAKDSVDLTQYVGKYKLAEGSPVESVTFSIKEGKLVAAAGEYPETALNFKVKDQFEDSGMGAVFTFLRADDKVLKVKIEVQGMELLAERVAEEKK
jgi:hypothetical protein